MADEVLALLALKGDEQVLDIGCGDGKITALIASRVLRGEVIGVDPSHEMIGFASAHFSHPNLHFDVADARALPFARRFNLIVSFNALHWIPEQDSVLRSIRFAMKPSGLVQLRLVTAGQQRSLESIVEEVRKSPRWNSYFIDFNDPYLRLTADEYKALARKNGFVVRRIHTELKAWNFRSRQAFFDFCSVGLIAWTKRLSANARSDFVNDVLNAYRSITGDPIGAEKIFEFYQTDVSLACA